MVEPLYNKKVNCLCCESSFVTKKTRASMDVIKKKDSDFCTYYEGENPLFYEINVCPQCSFAFSQSFLPLRPEKIEVVYKEYAQHVNKYGPVRLCDKRSEEEALKSFKLGLVCASLTDQSKLTIANICMRIAWLNRYRQNITEENKYLAKAADLYEESYIATDLTASAISKNKLLYIIAEVYGRLGNYEQAKKWFNMLLTQKNIEPVIKTLARDQWDEYKKCL